MRFPDFVNIIFSINLLKSTEIIGLSCIKISILTRYIDLFLFDWPYVNLIDHS